MKPLFNNTDKKVIFFDLYDTLIDRDRSFTQSLLMSLKEFTARWDNQDWNPAQAVEVFQHEWSIRKISTNKKARASIKKRRLVQTKAQRQFICLKKSLEGSPFVVTEAFLKTLMEQTHSLYMQHPVLFPDVKDTLEHLNKHFRIAIISNGKQDRLIKALQLADLTHIFPNHSIFVPSSSRTKKPHPNIFQNALKTMEAQPHQAIMVGNSWNKDIFGGNRCGMDSVWIQPKNQKIHIKRIGRNKVIIIGRFKQLLSLFNS